ncbi:Arc family DNA-binding protein [Escherichia coli]|uniref:Uncharacterized protein n=2 Tax=Enterobacterales TaxID=91347 RepID=A0AA44NJG1_CITFR|nr:MULTISPECIES: Arc family DNA-binding protein [Enterobacteriaceae]EGI6724978.1 Arc family DNA-binding protein [Escherichia coli]MCU3446791.1 Arc family DNA-binding protein [Enterobacter hormaechei subsp. steigerwaltii]AUZ68244.1 Arc family DNA-binding protein [Citrobacter freundii complex sp. CFNIH4]EHB5926085.1 Arc family DNA-binding protein [Escherichia coli]EIQ8250211.1 Arc family DNA-binding protein [Citrobacter freundii]
MKGASLIAPFGLRMPEELKEKIAERAKANGRSMNAEIVQILQDALPPDNDTSHSSSITKRDEFFSKVDNMDEFAAAMAHASSVYQEMLSKIVEEHMGKNNKKPTK